MVTPVQHGTREAGATSSHLSRRALIRRTTGVAVGAAVVWTVPNMRSTALAADATGTPAPVDPNTARPSGAGRAADPTQVRSGTLPVTGVDPKPLIVAGGAALAAGSALAAIAQDPEPSRGE